MSLAQERSLDATYRRRLTEGVLAFQQCGGGHAVFPPRPVCPTCGSRELAWAESAGDATIYSATTISPRDQDPYTVVILDVAEGFRIGDDVRVEVRAIAGGGDLLPLAALSTGVDA